MIGLSGGKSFLKGSEMLQRGFIGEKGRLVYVCVFQRQGKYVV